MATSRLKNPSYVYDNVSTKLVEVWATILPFLAGKGVATVAVGCEFFHDVLCDPAFYWDEAFDAEGNRFFFNARCNRSSWQAPAEFAAARIEDEGGYSRLRVPGISKLLLTKMLQTHRLVSEAMWDLVDEQREMREKCEEELETSLVDLVTARQSAGKLRMQGAAQKMAAAAAEKKAEEAAAQASAQQEKVRQVMAGFMEKQKGLNGRLEAAKLLEQQLGPVPSRRRVVPTGATRPRWAYRGAEPGVAAGSATSYPYSVAHSYVVRRARLLPSPSADQPRS